MLWILSTSILDINSPLREETIEVLQATEISLRELIVSKSWEIITG